MTDGISIDFMNKFLEEHPEPVEKEQPKGRRTTNQSRGHKGTIEEQDAFLECHHIEAGPRRATDNGGTEREIPCPNGPHQASVYRYEDGTFGFKCFHTSNKCHEMHWSDFAEMVEPGYRLKQEQAKLEELKTSVDTAMEKQDVPSLYDLAEQVAQLPTKEQEILCTTIKNTMAKCKDFSWSGFKKLLSEAAPQRNVSRRTMGGETYLKTSKGMLLRTQWGQEQLSNFAASITADITTDDGAEKSRGYAICADLHGRQFDFEVKSSEFSSCAWVDQYIGARATIGVGQSIKGHLGNAIKMCSEEIEEIQYYAHTGWRKIEGEMVYLHAGREISQHSQQRNNNNKDADKSINEPLKPDDDDDCQPSQPSQPKIRRGVKLDGNLKKYVLPSVPDDPVPAIRSSLRVLDITTYLITAPLYCSLWRAPLGVIDYGVHVAGESGLGKTELAALIQQHFGPEMARRDLPGTWESTENALEMQMFQAKDAIFVCDDFKPKGSQGMQKMLHAKADRVFRQVGNGSSRGRLTSSLESRPSRPPRCLLISTGEDVPNGQSLKSRAVVLIMTESIVKGAASQRLNQAQSDAARGLYAEAMAGYVAWLAPRIESLRAEMPTLIANEREALCIAGHARAGTNTAHMILGLKTFLHYATEVGAISSQEAETYLARCKDALIDIAADAAQENENAKPSEQWKNHLVAAIDAKKAHLVDSEGKCPGIAYGWKTSSRHVDGVTSAEETLRGEGEQVGWIDGDDLYLLPEVAYQVAKKSAATSGDDITTSEPMLRKFLLKDNLLASTESKSRRTLYVRRTLQGSVRKVLHLKKKILFPDETLSSPSADKADKADNTPGETASQASSYEDEPSELPDKLPDLADNLSGREADKSSSSNGFIESSTLKTDAEGSPANDVVEILRKVEQRLKGKSDVFWGVQNHLDFKNGFVPPQEFLNRLNVCLVYGDLMTVHAALDEVRRQLGSAS